MPNSPAVLITGASTGIGAATAIELARRGWRVFAGVRSMESAEPLRAASPSIVPVRLDVSDSATLSAAAETIGEELGETGLSGLVNNAGIAVNGPLEFVPIDELRRQLEVNIIGLVAVTQAMLPLLRRGQGDRRIVNISSVSGLVAFPFLAPYAASKHAVEAIGDALRIELAPWSIHVALIEPGPVATPIWAKARSAAETQASMMTPEARKLYSGYFAAAQGKIADAERRAVPVEAAVSAICHALTSPRPRTRYPLGPGSLLARVRRFIPDRLWDKLVLANLRQFSSETKPL